MASRLLHVFEEIEEGRENCVKALKLKNVVIRNNASFDELAAGVASIGPATQPVEMSEWIRPEEWPDLKTIVTNAEVVTEGNYKFVPIFGLLLKQGDYTDIKHTWTNSDAYAGFVTSGGHSQFGNRTYTFQEDDFLDIGLDYKVAWVILYYRTSSSWSDSPLYWPYSQFDTEQDVFKYCYEIILNYITASGTTTIAFNWPLIENIDYVDAHCSDFANANNPINVDAYRIRLPHKKIGGAWLYNLYSPKAEIVELPNVTQFNVGSGDNGWAYGAIINCPNLIEVSMPNLTTISGFVLGCCPKLRQANLSKLETVTYTLSNSNYSKYLETFANIGCNLYLPHLRTWNCDLIFSIPAASPVAARSGLNMPALETVNGDLTLGLQDVYLPSLKTVTGTLSFSAHASVHTNLPELEFAQHISVQKSGNALFEHPERFVAWLPNNTDETVHNLTLQGALKNQFTEEQLTEIAAKGWTVI